MTPYEKVDSRMNYKEDLYKIARSFGYGSISKCYHVLYETHNWTLSEIGDAFGVSKNAIRKTLAKLGVERRPLGGPNNTKLSVFNYLKIKRSAGTVTQKELSKQLNISVNTIQAIQQNKYQRFQG